MKKYLEELSDQNLNQLLHSEELNDRDEPIENMNFEEDDQDDDSFDDMDPAIANFSNCRKADELDPKLQLFVEKMQKINNQLQQT